MRTVDGEQRAGRETKGRGKKGEGREEKEEGAKSKQDAEKRRKWLLGHALAL